MKEGGESGLVAEGQSVLLWVSRVEDVRTVGFAEKYIGSGGVCAVVIIV